MATDLQRVHPRDVATSAPGGHVAMSAAVRRGIVAMTRLVPVATAAKVAGRRSPAAWPLPLVVLGHFVLMAIVLSPLLLLAR